MQPGGGSGGDGSGDSGTFLRATLNGDTFSADPALLSQAATQVAAGTYSITGGRINDYTIAFTLSSITGPGTYALGAGGNVPGGVAIVANGPSAWATPLNGTAGAFVITSLTDTRIVATFEFTADPNPGLEIGPLTVTNGELNLPLTSSGDFDPGSSSSGSTLAATIGGENYTAAGVSTAQDATGTVLSIVAVSESRTMTITLGALAGPGTYPFDPALPVNILRVIGTRTDADVCCWATNFGGSGELVVTSASESRLVGTFTATAGPSTGGNATGELTIEGSFDVELTP